METMIHRHGLSPYAAEVLTTSRALADYYREAVQAGGEGLAGPIANWLQNTVIGYLNEAGIEIPDCPVCAEELVELVGKVEEKKMTATAAKNCLRDALTGKGQLKDLLARQGQVVTDGAQLAEWIAQVLDGNADKVAAYRGGRTSLIQFFVGQVMRLSKGQAQAQRVKEILQAELEKGK
jgi:aspartyl-tRNA(Asn)/glutamyl-tRNA(Gln) amidotransferase subunit B